jgi:hypothetical protein
MENEIKKDAIHMEHRVKGILHQAGVMFEGTRIEDGKVLPDTPSAAALRLVSKGVILEKYVEQLRDSGLEV